MYFPQPWDKQVYIFRKKKCLLLFKHEIHLSVLHPDRKQCSLMFRAKIKESFLCIRTSESETRIPFLPVCIVSHTLKADVSELYYHTEYVVMYAECTVLQQLISIISIFYYFIFCLVFFLPYCSHCTNIWSQHDMHIDAADT